MIDRGEKNTAQQLFFLSNCMFQILGERENVEIRGDFEDDDDDSDRRSVLFCLSKDKKREREREHSGNYKDYMHLLFACYNYYTTTARVT